MATQSPDMKAKNNAALCHKLIKMRTHVDKNVILKYAIIWAYHYQDLLYPLHLTQKYP